MCGAPYALLVIPLLSAACGRTDGVALASAAADAVADPDRASAPELYEAGRSAYSDAAFERARELLDLAAERAAEAADTRVQARSLLWSCLASWRLVELSTGRQSCERALDVELRDELADLTSQTRNALGLIAWDESRLVDALDHFRQALDQAAALDDTQGVVRATGNLGLIQTDFGEFEAARRSFTTMLEGGAALGLPVFEANALTNLGMLAVRTGEPRSAIEHIEKARGIYRANKEVFRETNAIGQLATAWASLGDYARAFALIDTAIARAEALDLRQEIASNIEVLAAIRRGAGDLDGALSLYERARDFNTSAGRRLEQAANLRAQAELHHALNDSALARSHAMGALDLDREVGAPLAVMRDLLLLAEMESVAGDTEAADARMDEADSVGRALDARLPRVEFAIARARILERRGDAAAAIRMLDAIGSELEAVGFDPAWQADLIRLRALARLGRLDEAAIAGHRAVRTIELVRARIGSAMLRTSFLSEQSKAYWELANVLVRAGRASDAFEVADGAHGRTILDHLGARQAGAITGQPRERFALVDRMERLRESISGMHALPRGEQDSATLQALYDSLAVAHRAYSASGPLLPAPARSTAGILGGVPTRAEEVRASLNEDEVLVEYLVGDEGTLIFVVRRDGVRTARSSLGTDRAFNLSRTTRDLLSRPDELQPSAVLSRLWAELMEPVERTGALRGARRIVIVRHGPFASVPFAALRKGPNAPWLAELYELQVIPAAAALASLRHGRDVRAQSEPSTVFAPSPSALPATRAEARAIERVRPGMRTRIGREATEAAARAVFGNGAPILHFAAHAAFDTYSPLYSYIELAGGRDDAGNDGRLEIGELIEIRGSSGLVFLSACETAAGGAFRTAFSRSDDYSTIAQAFLYAGARNVIATLWRVADDGAEAFATRFYRHLEDQPIPRALALAQREMMTDPRYSAPFYWAGYQLAGDGGSLETAAPRP